MLTLIARFIINALGLLLIAEFIDGIHVVDFPAALFAAVVLGLLNAIVRPVIFIFTIPITLLSLGLFAFVINAMMFSFAAFFTRGFDVDSFWYALLGSILISIISAFGSRFIKASAE